MYFEICVKYKCVCFGCKSMRVCGHVLGCVDVCFDCVGVQGWESYTNYGVYIPIAMFFGNILSGNNSFIKYIIVLA